MTIGTDNNIIASLAEIQITLKHLTSEVGDLKRANEDRRISIDAVANSLRSESKTTTEFIREELEKLKKRQNTLETEFSLGKWALAIILATLIIYVVGRALKVILPEIEGQVSPQVIRQK